MAGPRGAHVPVNSSTLACSAMMMVVKNSKKSSDCRAVLQDLPMHILAISRLYTPVSAVPQPFTTFTTSRHETHLPMRTLFGLFPAHVRAVSQDVPLRNQLTGSTSRNRMLRSCA
eukprot:36250-Prymnesium_polylepis.1